MDEEKILAAPSRKRFPYIVVVLLLFLLGLVSGLLWFELKERFPKLAEGMYVGSIEDLSLGPGLADASFVVESRDDGQQLDVMVFAPGFELNRVKAVMRGEDPESAGWLLPITFEGAGANFKLLGDELEPGQYGGKIVQLHSSSSGAWSLKRVEQILQESSSGNPSEMALLLLLKKELNQINARIAKAEALAPKQKEEIERLSKFVTEGVELKRKGEARYNEERTKFKQAVERLKERQQEAHELENRIELSQRLTAMGKLVALARDSLEREGRWLESMLRSSSDETASGIDTAYQHGEEILKVRAAIEQERQRIGNLRASADENHRSQ